MKQYFVYHCSREPRLSKIPTMKTKFVFLLAALLLPLQPLLGSSSLDGGEKQREQSASVPAQSHDLGEAGPVGAEANPDLAALGARSDGGPESEISKDLGGVAANNEVSQAAKVIHEPSVTHGRKGHGIEKNTARNRIKAAPDYDPEKLSPVFGIISLGMGVIGVFSFAAVTSGLFFLVIMLLATPFAVILGAIGMSKKRQCRGLAIAGFVLGLLCLAIALVFLVALILLFF